MCSFETIDLARTAAEASPQLLAYLDPGMGSMVFQVLVAGALSASFFIKTWVRQLRANLVLRARR
jgi:hypothetical protein